MPASEKFLNWLSVRPSWWGRFELVLATIGVGMVWAMLVISAISFSAWYFGTESLAANKPDHTTMHNLLKGEFVKLAFVVTMIVVFEEFTFRFLPFAFILFLMWMNPRFRSYVLPTLVISSLAFGLVHLTNFNTVTTLSVVLSILIQGFLGLTYGIVFLKYTGLRGKYVFGALLLSTVTHLSWNAITMAPFVVMS